MSPWLRLRLKIAKKPWWKSLTSKIQSKLNSNPKSITIAKSNHNNKKKHKNNFFDLRLRRKKQRRIAGFLLKQRSHYNSIDNRLNIIVPTKKVLTSTTSVVDHDHNNKVEDVEPIITKSSCVAADDMWESMGIASPLMHGIDARAEEFIAKFRADMEVQEMLARGL